INSADGEDATVGGGNTNIASGPKSTIAGGFKQTASGNYSAIGGGSQNEATAEEATVGGGGGNKASGNSSTIGGGLLNEASGDDSRCYTNTALTPGVRLPPGSGAWVAISDRNAKANFAELDGREVLARLVKIPLSTWNYKTEDATVRHMGPMAQDFFAAYHLG